MHFQPVRKVIHRGNIKRVGLFPSEKVGRCVAFESLLERDILHLLEFDPDVITFCEQPIDIKYLNNNITHHYFPDLAIEYSDDSIKIFEVKPSTKLNDQKLKLKLEAASIYCKSMNYEYEIFTEKSIPLQMLANIKMLFGYRKLYSPINIRRTIANELLKHNVLDLYSLSQITNPLMKSERNNSLATIYSLIYNHFIETDLNVPISFNSKLWLSKRSREDE